MSGLEGARCVGQWWLFDSTDTRDHIEARKLCADCPAIVACGGLLKASLNTLRYHGGGPSGTWAGNLVGSRKREPQHGTERGYQDHCSLRELPCRACQVAHIDHWQGTSTADAQEAS